MLLLLRLEKFAILRWREFFWKIKKWSMNTFRLALAAFFKKFVETLLSSDWESEERKIREWVVERDER